MKVKAWNYFEPFAIYAAALFWLAIFLLFGLTSPDSFAGSAQHMPRCLAQHTDASIIIQMIDNGLSPDAIKQRANGTIDIDDARKADIALLVDEATALRALECDEHNTPCKAEKSLAQWPNKVFERCRDAGTQTKGEQAPQ